MSAQFGLPPPPERGLADPELIARVMRLWGQGQDTVQIALTIFNDKRMEARVCWALRLGREQRREGR